ncbi:MAG: PDZ domain-containing protein [Nitrospira sp. LK70]|nr:PDZ domain-containing protein [Nitrospira sp. LK70]
MQSFLSLCAVRLREVALVIAAMAPALLSGCGVGYTIVKSEAKLDRLSVPMTKAQVLQEIGRPDRILRDDGRILVWEYSLTARRQWLYEIAYCPISVWFGGCILYPFTNFASDQREYPHHVVLVDDELCAWGPPAAILQRRRVCVTAGGMTSTRYGRGVRPEPVVTGNGPINRETIDQYHTMAVMLFKDADGAPGTGSRVAGIVTNLMLDLDVDMVERSKLDEVLKEQVIQLTHADDADALEAGKLIGAHAIIVGEVQQWERREQERAHSVSLTLRMIDVETGLLLFSGQGHLTDPTTDDPEGSARLIVHRMLARFGAQTGLLGSGQIGVSWELQGDDVSRFYVVKELGSETPADKAGLKVGDRIIACNGASLSEARTEREAKRFCQVEAGQVLQLNVRRADQLLVIAVTAEKRPGL